MDKQTRLNPVRFPFTTTLLCAAAGIVFAVPQLQALLVYSRVAIDDGEIWRLITGNLVHLSSSHFACDVAALLLVGALVELRGYRHFAILCLVSAASVGVTVYVGNPELSVFGGLSGIVMASAALLCLNGTNDSGAWRRACWLGLVCLAIKLSAELGLGSSVGALAESESMPFVPVPSSHAAGVLTALVMFACSKLRALRKTDLTSVRRVYAGARWKMNGHWSVRRPPPAPGAGP